MPLAISTVCTSIAALTVDGVKIRDLDNIPAGVERLAPILFPDPENPVSNFAPMRMSYGGGSSAKMDADYDLNYMFIFCKIGAGRTGLDYIEDCMEKIQAIYDAVLSIDTITGAVDVFPNEAVQMTTITDPSGNNYLGCSMSFHVKEFWR